MAAPASGGRDRSPTRNENPVKEVEMMEYEHDTPAKSVLATASEAGSTPQPYYVPQFSAATDFILKRMKTESQSPGPAVPQAPASLQPDKDAYMDAKTRLVQTMRTTWETAAPAAPETALTLSLPMGTNSEDILNASRKRKRAPVGDKVDFTQNTIAFPTPGPMTSRPQPSDYTREKAIIDTGVKQCLDCRREESTTLDPILQCSRCFGSWHTQCALAKNPEGPTSTSEFLCTDCTTMYKEPLDPQDSSAAYRQRHIDRMREKRLLGLPKGVVPPKPELVGFKGGVASGLARTEYFYGKKKTDLLNVLSFCDQLKPQLLVDLLVSVSKKHPDLPMFDSPDWATQVPSASRVKQASTTNKPRGHNRPRHGHIISTKSRQRVKTVKRSLKTDSTVEVGGGGDQQQEYEEEDTMPATWQQAGQGLYAKLMPETQDRLFLADENDEEAFSHFMVDNMGRQIVAPV